MNKLLMLIAVLMPVALMAAGVVSVEEKGVPLWQYALILSAPAILAMIGTIILVRFMRAIYLDDHKKPMPRGRAFWSSMIAGAVLGVLVQYSLQQLVSVLTGLPVIWELLIFAAGNGLYSLLGYEVVRWVLAWRYRSTGNPTYRSIFNWISVKTDKSGKPISDVTQLFSQRDQTDLKEDITDRKL